MRAIFACALVLAACGSSHVNPGGPFGCPERSDGIILLDWTVDGQAPSMTSCAGIAKMSLFLDNQFCGEVEIDPVPCALDKFRYDTLPEGPAEVLLQGFDSRGVIKVQGTAMVTLTATLPAKPTPVSLH